jgi:hypothetical protein
MRATTGILKGHQPRLPEVPKAFVKMDSGADILALNALLTKLEDRDDHEQQVSL